MVVATVQTAASRNLRVGKESLEAVKKLCAGDPARLGDIVRRII